MPLEPSMSCSWFWEFLWQTGQSAHVQKEPRESKRNTEINDISIWWSAAAIKQDNKLLGEPRNAGKSLPHSVDDKWLSLECWKHKKTWWSWREIHRRLYAYWGNYCRRGSHASQRNFISTTLLPLISDPRYLTQSTALINRHKRKKARSASSFGPVSR